MSGLAERLKHKRIVIWGTGNTGHAFYQEYRDKISLSVCTSSEENPKPIAGMEVVEYRDLDKNKDFIVICSIYYETIMRRLFADGWMPGRDYLRSDLFNAEYEAANGKKLIVTIGRCHIWRISSVLNCLSQFREKYTIVHFDQPKVCMSENEFHYMESAECMEMLANADILLRPATVMLKLNHDYEYLQNKLPEKGRVIAISLPVFGSYWPQDTGKERQMAKWYVSPYGKNLKAFGEKDNVIEKLIESGKSKREIIDIISDADYFDREQVLQNHSQTMTRAYFWDRIADIKIADFIEENYQTIKLYCDRGHLHYNLLKEYVRRFLTALQEEECIEQCEKIDWEAFETGLSAPTDSLIYPSTAKILGLGFVNENTLYRFQLADQTKFVTFREGLEMQTEYYMRARKLLEMCYVDRSQV